MGGQTYYGITDLGAAGLPAVRPRLYHRRPGCSGYAVYSEVVNVTEAWQFVKHVVSIEGQNAYSETGGCVPVRKDLLEDKNAAWRKSLPTFLTRPTMKPLSKIWTAMPARETFISTFL